MELSNKNVFVTGSTRGIGLAIAKGLAECGATVVINGRTEAAVDKAIAAAKADGHVDERERALIEGEFTKLDNDQELQHWLHAELNKPLDPADVADAIAQKQAKRG